MLERADPESAARIMPRDRKRIVRALEVYVATGRPLTALFSETASLIADCDVVSFALRLPAALTAERVARRVDEQFARGIVTEVEALLARGVPSSAQPFGGLVYRQVMEMLRGVRDEAATRALIAQENRRYARRQLIWFRKGARSRRRRARPDRRARGRDAALTGADAGAGVARPHRAKRGAGPPA
jgi:tRNA dimethylallyltransferase